MRSGGQEVARYAYDGQGRRITKTVGGVARQFYYGLDGGLLRETGPDGDRVHLSADGTPLALVNNGAVYYLHPDRLGTVQRITDANKQVVWSAKYEPFGKAAIASGIEYNPRFPGQYYDAETGLYYNHFRDYDPGIGRYPESDPIGLRGGVNTYAYVGNDPLRFIDPLGLADNGTGPWTTFPSSDFTTGGNSAAIGRGVLDGAFNVLPFGVLKNAAKLGPLFRNLAPAEAIGDAITFPTSQIAKVCYSGKLNYVVTDAWELIIGRSGHTSLSKGMDVRAAGEARFVDGKLKSLDNASGHYRPSGIGPQQAAESAFENAGFDAVGKYSERF